MTERHEDHVGGKGFAPSESNVDDRDADSDETVIHGGGKQFAMDVGDPEHDASARQKEGSGKRFAWDIGSDAPERDDDDPVNAAEDERGSGKQFRPGE
jgi:hypothetical protein